MFTARSRHPSRADLPALGEIPAEETNVLVVDLFGLGLAKQARLPLERRATGSCPLRARFLASLRTCCHVYSLRVNPELMGRVPAPVARLQTLARQAEQRERRLASNWRRQEKSWGR
jgi:hypothetical protein